MAIPPQLVIPLSMHIGSPATPAVQVGDTVLKGQMIGTPSGPFSAAVHASSSGRVTAIENRPVPHASGLEAPCIVIETDGEDRAVDPQPMASYQDVPVPALIDHLRESGIAGMGGAGFPTAVKLTPRYKIDTLILNGTECEPYITADHMLMRARAGAIVGGAKLLAHILGEPETILIGIEDNKPDAIEIMQAACEDTRIEVVEFPTKYPSGGEKQLIEILTGKQVPSGSIPAEIGIVLQNVGTAAACWDAVDPGVPLTSRITTFVGESIKHSGNYTTRIGTPLSFALEQVGFEAGTADRVIVGGPMMGFAVSDHSIPATKITNCVLAPSSTEISAPAPAQPCIRCGQCAEACPAELLPQQLLWYSQARDHEKLDDYNLFDCIECGACSYVCPSNIPLVQYYRASKGEIREAQREKIKSDRARDRFEFRKLRLEQEAAARQAKRRQRLESKKAQASTAENSAPDNTDLVAAAIKKASQQPSDPAQEAEKLGRQISTLEERLTDLATQISQSQSEQEIAKLEAKHKNIELKLSGLRERLGSLSTTDSAESPKQTAEFAAPSEQRELDAASTAIERAKQRTAEAAVMSEEEKLQSAINSLETRIKKTESKIEEAREQNSDTLDALQAGLTRMQAKLQETRAKLEAEQNRS